MLGAGLYQTLEVTELILGILRTREKSLFIIGATSFENSDFFQLLLKIVVNSYRDVLVGLKLTARHYKFMMQYHF